MELALIIGIIISFIILIFILVFVILPIFSKSQLPEKRPHNLVVSMYISEGMLPRGSSIFISENNSEYSNSFDGKKITIPLKLTNEELDRLYAAFKENDFASIKTEKQMVYDRGGISISISFGTTNIEKSDSGVSFISDVTSRNKFNKVKEVIDLIVNTKMQQSKKSLEIIIDPPIMEKIQSIQIDQQYIPMTIQNNSKITVSVFDYEHTLNIVLKNPKSKYGVDTYVLDFSNKTKIQLVLIDGLVKIKDAE